MDIIEMYEGGASIPQISKDTGVPRSTVRSRLVAAGVKLRSVKEGLDLAAKDGRLGGGLRGKRREPFSAEWRRKISEAHLRRGEKHARGVRVTSAGYLEYTRGKHKGRSVHVVAMEQRIGRRLFINECVHHRNGNRQDNSDENLELMTRADHAALHAIENAPNRKRDARGRFLCKG